MRCGCVPRIFRRGSPSRFSTEAVSLLSATTEPCRSETSLQREACPDRLSPSASCLKDESTSEEKPQNTTPSESVQGDEDGSEASAKATTAVFVEEAATTKENSEEKPLGQQPHHQHHNSHEKKSFTARRGGGLFLRNFFKTVNPIDDSSSVWVRCECLVDEGLGSVRLIFRLEEESSSATHHRTSRSATIHALFRIRGRKNMKEEPDISDLIRARHPSSTSAKTEEMEDEEPSPVDATRPKERSGFCFGWGQAGAIDDEDEAITRSELMTEAPPGLVGLMNLGNTCFLNAALQCLRCTPGFVHLVVPELSQGFDCVTKSETGELCSENTSQPQDKCQGQQIRRTLKRRRNRSHSFSSLFPRPVHLEWDCTVISRASSLPDPLPYEIGGRLKGETGLAGGSVLRLSSAPNLTYENKCDAAPVAMSCPGNEEPYATERPSKDLDKDSKPLGGDNYLDKTSIMQPNEEPAAVNQTSAEGRDHHEMTSGTDAALPSTSTTNDAPPFVSESKKTEITESKEEEQEKQAEQQQQQQQAAEDEPELSVDFISAFQKLVMDVCLGEADHHRSPRDLYLQLKKLPQGEWFCDGGQHDCQEIFKVLLDTIHANYAEQSVQTETQFGRCISDISTTEREALEEIEVENLKANSLWRNYLSHDASPITDVFAGQLQIVRSCQKCHCRSTTYEPFWDLSLSLSREKVSWFNPGRMPGSLDDLMRAFTAAEVLQGDEAPYCDCCEQKSPATRRILIHRFPKVLVINIKRFKYTKDGREKLTSNITFPSRALRLHSFASKEHQHGGMSEIYDLYAVSNHYGTLGGGHYTAFCKVKDAGGKDGWYSFNDKTVTKISEDMVVTPNAYILFYAMRPSSDSQTSTTNARSSSS